MRVGYFVDDPKDHQTEISYSWTRYDITGNENHMYPVPPTGDQFRQQMIGGNGPQAGVDGGGQVRAGDGR